MSTALLDNSRSPHISVCSDIHLPSLEQPSSDQQQEQRHSPSLALPPLSNTEATRTGSPPPKPVMKKDHSSISLPPIDTSAAPSLVAAKPGQSSEREEALHIVSKKSDTALIVEAAKRARENLIAGIPSPKKVLTKMTSFTTPRMSVSRNSSTRSKYIVPHSKTTVIDIEGTGEVAGRERHNSIPCGKSQSHPYLTQSKPSPRRAKNSDKQGSDEGGVSYRKPHLSEATLKRVRDGRTVVTIAELEKLTRRTGKSSSMHNTPLHHKPLHHHNVRDHSPHRKMAGHSSISLSKTALGLSPPPLKRKDFSSRSLATIHKTERSGRPAATTTVVTKTGKKVTVRRALPQPPPLKRRRSPFSRRQLVPSKGREKGRHEAFAYCFVITSLITLATV